jgi:hypothetical protein
LLIYLKVRDNLADAVNKGWFQIQVEKNDGSGGVVMSQAEVILTLLILSVHLHSNLTQLAESEFDLLIAHAILLGIYLCFENVSVNANTRQRFFQLILNKNYVQLLAML